MGLKAVANPAAGGQPGSFTSLTVSGLTAGRVVYTGTGGLLSASANLTYDNVKLTVGGSVQGSPNLEIAQVGNSDSGTLYSSTTVDAGNRNWALIQNRTAFGDMVWRVSNAAGGNPFTAGSDVLSMTSAGIEVPGLRVNVTPTAETPSATHTAVFNINGTNYKFLCLAA